PRTTGVGIECLRSRLPNPTMSESGRETGRSFSPAELQKIAERHGIDIAEVSPRTPDERLSVLGQILSRQDVTFPVSAERAEAYFQAAAGGVPFTVGALSETSVDLGEYAAEQHHDRYSFEEHLSWACLLSDQQRTKHQFACREYLEGEELFEIGGTVIPDYYILNARIYQQTGWQLATVNMIIPAELFFTCHSYRFFPVTTFMRPLEQDYLQEPDIGHDVAGHVATFTIPTVAKLMQDHGKARDLIYAERDERLSKAGDEQQAKGICSRADELLAYAERIYWFTVEFGLVMQDDALRAFGAGILSSPGETAYSVHSPAANRILIDPSNEQHLMRLVCTDYLISEYQKTYFITQDFSLLESLTPERIVHAAEKAARVPHFSWRDVIPGDKVLNLGQAATTVNEKYYRLVAGQPMDDCMLRTAIRNMQVLSKATDPLDDGTQLDLKTLWSAPMPELPELVKGAPIPEFKPQASDVELKPISFVADYI
ncbi:MAG: hypothetical protein AAF394_14685, partial [Planctomycetota bacterium]